MWCVRVALLHSPTDDNVPVAVCFHHAYSDRIYAGTLAYRVSIYVVTADGASVCQSQTQGKNFVEEADKSMVSP